MRGIAGFSAVGRACRLGAGVTPIAGASMQDVPRNPHPARLGLIVCTLISSAVITTCMTTEPPPQPWQKSPPAPTQNGATP